MRARTYRVHAWLHAATCMRLRAHVTVRDPMTVQSSAEEYIENREYTTSEASVRKGKLTTVSIVSSG